MTEQCAFCGTAAATDRSLQKCSGCRQRKYCNQACQRAAWQGGHREECRRLREGASSSSSSSPSSPPASAATPTSGRALPREGAGAGSLPLSQAAPSADATSSGSSSSRDTEKNKKNKSKSSRRTTQEDPRSPSPAGTIAGTPAGMSRLRNVSWPRPGCSYKCSYMTLLCCCDQKVFRSAVCSSIRPL